MSSTMFVAVPLHDDGTEGIGQPITIGDRWVPVLSGHYASFVNFMRYQLDRYGNGHVRWNIYVISPTSHAWVMYYSDWHNRKVEVAS